MGFQVTDQTNDDPNSVSVPTEGSSLRRLATGTEDASPQDYQLEQISGAVSPERSPLDPAAAENAALQAMAEIAPQNPMEAMLAGQMVALHHSIMDGYKRAARARMYPECDDVDMRQTLKASTVFNRQVETMMKLQKPENKGESRGYEPHPITLMTPEEKKRKFAELLRMVMDDKMKGVRLASHDK